MRGCRRNSELKVLFVCNAGYIISPTLAEYFKNFGYETRFAKCPRKVEDIYDPKCPIKADDINKFDSDWADFIFTTTKEIQIQINVLINPIRIDPKDKTPNKLIYCLDIEEVLYKEKFEPKLLIYIDYKTQEIIDFIACNIREGYSYPQEISEAERIESLVICLNQYNPSLTEINKAISNHLKEITNSLKFYQNDYDNRPTSMDD